MDHQDGLGAWRNHLGNGLRRDVLTDWIDISKDRFGAALNDGTGGSNEGSRGNNHFVVETDF